VLQTMAARAGRPTPVLAPAARTRLATHQWPGDLLELEAVLGRALASGESGTLEVDDLGLDRESRELLRTIVAKFDGGPVGLSTLAVSLGEEPDTIEDVYEPYLLQLGFIQRTPRGRTITKLGREHLGAAPEKTALF